MEKTLVFLKPDAISKNVTNQIIKRILDKGFVITDKKYARLSREIACEHYNHISSYDFFNNMIDYVTSDECLFMIITGDNVISEIRNMIGATRGAPSGTIRGDFGSESYKNLIHASDSIENVEIEIKRFFGK